MTSNDDIKAAAKAKIAKLMALAQDDRGNEFEAESALRQAEKMMRKHGIDAAEIQDRTGERPVYRWATIHVPAGAPHPIRSSPTWFGILITGIGRFTDTKVGYSFTHEHGVCASFSGDSVDVEFAVYLCKHLRDECRRRSAAFPGDRADKECFRKGYAGRVQDRMLELVAERKKAFASNGTALVVVQNKVALRDIEFGEQKYGRARGYSLGARGGDAGRAAGDRASLGRPIGGNSTARLS